MHPSLKFWSVARKAGLTALAVVGEAVTYGLLPSPWDKVGTAVVAVAAYAGVYATRNVPQAGAGAPSAGAAPLVDLEALRGTLPPSRPSAGPPGRYPLR